METYNFMYPYYFSALLHHLLTAKVKKLSTLCASPYHLLLLKEQLSFPVGPYAKLFTFLRASRFTVAYGSLRCQSSLQGPHKGAEEECNQTKGWIIFR
jgi:hypothetical protein